MPVYFNEKAVSSFAEDEYTPTKGSDMKLTSVVNTEGVYYFDRKQVFENFCNKKQLRTIFENNFKLDSIYEKAVELGIVDNDDETIPQEMAQYWTNLCGTDLVAMTQEANRAISIKLFDDYLCKQLLKNYYWPCRASLGDANKKTSSFSLRYGFGATVMCYKKWFGGTKRWYWLFGTDEFKVILENKDDDNKYCSYASFLI